MDPNEYEHNEIAQQARERYTHAERVDLARLWLRGERGRLVSMDEDGVGAPATVVVSPLTFGLTEDEMNVLRAEVEGDTDA